MWWNFRCAYIRALEAHRISDIQKVHMSLHFAYEEMQALQMQ